MSSPSITVSETGEITVIHGDLLATTRPPIRFAHLGCKLLKTLPPAMKKERAPIPTEILRQWDTACPGWNKPRPAAAAVGAALKQAARVSGTSGVDLWDTMRVGSDYWRPGKILSQATKAAACEATFMREDDLCPEAALLGRFREGLSFPAFAEEYAQSVSRSIDLAVAAVVLAQARNRLAVFYCVDPYVPGYGKGDERFSEVPYEKRSWPMCGSLRDAGCHRVVLADVVARRLRSLAVAGEVMEVDPSTASAHVRSF